MSTMKQVNWKLDRAGVAPIDGIGLIGLAARNYASNQKLRPRGRVMREAVRLTNERGGGYVTLEVLMHVHVGTPLPVVCDDAAPLRRAMARTRKQERIAAVEAAREARNERRRQRAAARKAEAAQA